VKKKERGKGVGRRRGCGASTMPRTFRGRRKKEVEKRGGEKERGRRKIRSLWSPGREGTVTIEENIETKCLHHYWKGRERTETREAGETR